LRENGNVSLYSKPLQHRAIATEQRLLDSLDLLLREKSLSRLSIDEIADHAHLSRGAFLKRFGTKKQALMTLWERYGERSLVVKKRLMDNLVLHSNALDACCMVSTAIEDLQRGDFSANRAMFDDFEEELQIHSITKMVFMECVDLVFNIRKKYIDSTTQRNSCDFAAAQLLITLNYNYVMKAMPGFPADPDARHRLIGRLAVEILRE
jgi:AcrR family transcriptional regulator